MTKNDWLTVVAVTDDFLEEAALKDHSGPQDAYQDLVETWSKPMKCVAVAYLIQRQHPHIAQWLAGEIFPEQPVLMGMHPDSGEKIFVQVPWFPR